MNLVILSDFYGVIREIFEPILVRSKGQCPRIEDLVPEFKKKINMSKPEMLDIAIQLAIKDEYQLMSVPWTFDETIEAVRMVDTVSKKKRKLAPDMSTNIIVVMSLGITKTIKISKTYQQWVDFEINKDPFGLE